MLSVWKIELFLALFCFRKTILDVMVISLKEHYLTYPNMLKIGSALYFNPESNASVENVFVVIGNPQASENKHCSSL